MIKLIIDRIMKAQLKSINLFKKEDVRYYNKILRINGLSKFSSDKIAFYPTSYDWKIARKDFNCIFIPVTSRCNSDCKICYIKDGRKFDEMSLENIKSLMKKIGKNKHVVLFGGEPTTRTDIFDIIKLICKSGNKPDLYTNGLMLANFDYVKKLQESGLKRIHFSFDGFREEVYEKLRGNRNQLYIKLKALYNIYKIGIETIMSSTIVHGINEDQIPFLLEFCKSFAKRKSFIIGIRFLPAVPHGKFDLEVDDFITPTDILKILEKHSRGTINMKYFLEFRRLLMNINSLLKKIHIYFPIGSLVAYAPFKFERTEIKELIGLKDLKKINFCIENFRIISLTKYFLKYIILNRNLMNRNLNKLFMNGVLIIEVDYPATPITHMNRRKDSIGISKSNGAIVFIFQG